MSISENSRGIVATLVTTGILLLARDSGVSLGDFLDTTINKNNRTGEEAKNNASLGDAARLIGDTVQFVAVPALVSRLVRRRRDK